MKIIINRKYDIFFRLLDLIVFNITHQGATLQFKCIQLNIFFSVIRYIIYEENVLTLLNLVYLNIKF